MRRVEQVVQPPPLPPPLWACGDNQGPPTDPTPGFPPNLLPWTLLCRSAVLCLGVGVAFDFLHLKRDHLHLGVLTSPM